jgi:hypothetical protein
LKKKSSVESSVLCTHTPIFLQANMAGYGAQGGYGVQDPNVVAGGQGGFNQQQAGGSDHEAIKQQKIQAVEQDPSLTAEEKKHRRHKIEEEIAAGQNWNRSFNETSNCNQASLNTRVSLTTSKRRPRRVKAPCSFLSSKVSPTRVGLLGTAALSGRYESSKAK